MYIFSWKDSFEYNKEGFMAQSLSKEQTESYSYQLTLDLYNSSGEVKIMRDIAIIYSDNKNELHKSKPKDDTTMRHSGPSVFIMILFL